jgi:hypothetical protein
MEVNDTGTNRAYPGITINTPSCSEMDSRPKSPRAREVEVVHSATWFAITDPKTVTVSRFVISHHLLVGRQ